MRFQTASHQDWNFNLRAAVLTPNLVAAVPLRPQTAFAQGADFRPRAAVLRPQVRRAPCDPDCLCPGCRPPPTIRGPRAQSRRRRARRGPRLPSPQLAAFHPRPAVLTLKLVAAVPAEIPDYLRPSLRPSAREPQSSRSSSSPPCPPRSQITFAPACDLPTHDPRSSLPNSSPPCPPRSQTTLPSLRPSAHEPRPRPQVCRAP
jgi:hypothetical protein